MTATFWIQWKGTEVCGDFRCPCGAFAHVCREMFMYRLKCYACEKTYEASADISLKEVPDDGTPFVETEEYTGS